MVFISFESCSELLEKGPFPPLFQAEITEYLKSRNNPVAKPCSQLSSFEKQGLREWMVTRNVPGHPLFINTRRYPTQWLIYFFAAFQEVMVEEELKNHPVWIELQNRAPALVSLLLFLIFFLSLCQAYQTKSLML